MTATTIEQSKHLLELGLDPDSADMYYTGHRSIHNPKEIEYTQEPRIRTKFVSFDRLEVFFPAWSLSALLEVMPNNDYWDICLLQYIDQRWQCVFDDVEFSNGETKSFVADKPIDAAYEMVCWLLENNLIKKGGEE